MEFYFGGFGAGKTWGLASESPIVVYCKKDNEFIALKSIEDAKKHEGTSDEIYLWNNGVWCETQFVVLLNKPSRAIGFNQQKPKP